MVQTNLDYDREEDDLFIYREGVGKAKGSIVIGNFIIDFSHAGNVIGLEITEATDVLSKIIDAKIDKVMLSNGKKAYLKQEIKNNALIIYFGMLITTKEKPIQIASCVSLPIPLKVT